MGKVLAAILDLDGTLVDSNDAHALSWKQVLEDNGIRNSYPEIRQMIGMGNDKLLPKLAGVTYESSRGKMLSQAKNIIFQRDFIPSLKPFPCARELLERMKAASLKIAIASSSQSKDLSKLLKTVGIEDLVDAPISSSPSQPSKPDPDLIESALAALGLRPEQALMVGDTPYDIAAARNAGVETIALRSGGWDDDALYDALAIFNDPADLLNHFDSSPFVQDLGRRPTPSPSKRAS